MQNDLCGKRLVGNFLKWCDTPLVRKPGFSTSDGCWLFDEIEGDVRSVVLHTENNVYLSIPHLAGDPVMAANKERVLQFLRTPFFDNAAALECQLAAICSTLRGVSIVRAFVTVGPSGVGQSLNTCLVANLFGGSHGFMDMNVFFSEDELRKQADTFTGKVNTGSHVSTTSDMKTLVVLFFFVQSGPLCVPQVVITGQEAPQHRQTAPVAARLPYTILTKMVTFSGWKRFEMNETLKFHEVTEMTFPSIMRRSLIINCKARSVSAQRLASITPGKEEYFLMQEDMKDFVTSQPAAGALFTVVLGELCDSSVATFWQKIERYAEGGGDGGLTRATMRAACGLPAEDVALHPDGAGHAVAPRPGAGVVETVPARQLLGCLLGDEEGLVRCQVSLVGRCVERGWGFCSEYHVSRLHQDVWPRVPARDRV